MSPFVYVTKATRVSIAAQRFVVSRSSRFSLKETLYKMATAVVQVRKRILRDEDMTKVEFETSEEVDVTPTFDTMGLREDLLRGIYAYGRPEMSAASGAELRRLKLTAAQNMNILERFGLKFSVGRSSVLFRWYLPLGSIRPLGSRCVWAVALGRAVVGTDRIHFRHILH